MDNDHQSGLAYRVGILPIPGFALVSYSCTVEPFRAANLLSGKKLYDVVHFTLEGGADSSGAAFVNGDHRPGDQVDIDLLLVVAGGDPFGVEDQAIFSWLRQMDRQGVRIGGIHSQSDCPALLVEPRPPIHRLLRT